MHNISLSTFHNTTLYHLQPVKPSNILSTFRTIYSQLSLVSDSQHSTIPHCTIFCQISPVTVSKHSAQPHCTLCNITTTVSVCSVSYSPLHNTVCLYGTYTVPTYSTVSSFGTNSNALQPSTAHCISISGLFSKYMRCHSSHFSTAPPWIIRIEDRNFKW